MNKLEAYVFYTQQLQEAFRGKSVIEMPLLFKHGLPEPVMLNMVLYGLDHEWLETRYPTITQKNGVIYYALTEKGIKFLFPDTKGAHHE